MSVRWAVSARHSIQVMTLAMLSMEIGIDRGHPRTAGKLLDAAPFISTTTSLHAAHDLLFVSRDFLRFLLAVDPDARLPRSWWKTLHEQSISSTIGHIPAQTTAELPHLP